MQLWTHDRLFSTIEALVMQHSPSGMEAEINRYLLEQLAALGVEHWQDEADNIIVRIPGTRPDAAAGAVAITGHKDEIGGIVKAVGEVGRVSVRRLGGAFPWVYGEGVVDLLGDRETVSGILSFGSRHVSHESPQKLQQDGQAVRWEDAWVETKQSAAALTAAGIRPGTRMVVGKHRKQPLRMGDYIASYTLDNKASVAILLGLAEQVTAPPVDVYLVASAKEEVGAIGALFFSQRQRLSQLIALEICPLSAEYPIQPGPAPVLLSQDGYGLYDEGLNQALLAAADRANLPVQVATISGFGSDASIAMKFGHVAKAACLSFPTENTHGFEIAHLGAIASCLQLLVRYLKD
ncbi:M42 family peptidase [Romeria aff. gracilis LEGE 07310]|uniref:M42 family peptidase n=1 Tax=Vasconcelosia minhoensis LEGE 07310 TaxID=915328 RepID=A0A8J7AMV7_9CYAN|nr:M42 family peptidase [Romeria gracilis]MBE9077880.1 M42 family peptidase [Romeria aff. gracilis LEGE 07310]